MAGTADAGTQATGEPPPGQPEEPLEAGGGDVFEAMRSLWPEDCAPGTEGLLTELEVAAGLSRLEHCDEHSWALVAATLRDKGLTDVSPLERCGHLRHVDLSGNRLTDLSALRGLPFLERLDASHNALPELLGFPPPRFLTHVCFSHNQVRVIPDLDAFWSLVHLDVSHNLVDRISGLQCLRYLQHLDLSHNLIKRFENLSQTRVRTLLMAHNQISEFEQGDEAGLKTMLDLRAVSFDHNQLQSLAPFQGAYTLKVVGLAGNCVRSPRELDHLQGMVSLEVLDLRGNPVAGERVYRHQVLHLLPSLATLDEVPVPVEDKVLARDVFRPSELERAARLRVALAVRRHLGPDTRPADRGPQRLLVLVGPLASSKGCLVRALAACLPLEVEIGVSHTTRPCQDGGVEEHGKSYYFISNYLFDEMAMKGEFLSTNTVLGWRFGFSRRELARAAQAQKLCVTHTDVVGALALFDSAVRPHLVLTAPRTERLHRQLLGEKYEARDGAVVRRREARPVPENPPDVKEIPATTNEGIQRAEEYFYDTVLQSRESYLSLHRNNPGFFLETILVDSLDEAVVKLAGVVEQVLECSTNEKPIYSIEDDPVYRAMSSARLLEFKKEILSNQSTARKQAESFKSYCSTKLRK